jgi:hypothetical protein
MKLSHTVLLAGLGLALPVFAADAAAPATPPATATSATAKAAAPAAPAAATAPADAAADPLWVYMVTRIKLTGTDLTQVVFFQHNAITTMEACEAERQAGLSTGWNYFSRYYLRTLKGISYRVDYRCVESKQKLAYWRQGVPLDISYLVSTVDNRLVIKPYRNFFDCRDALQAITKTENIDHFCATSSQAVLPPAAAAPP